MSIRGKNIEIIHAATNYEKQPYYFINLLIQMKIFIDHCAANWPKKVPYSKFSNPLFGLHCVLKQFSENKPNNNMWSRGSAIQRCTLG